MPDQKISELANSTGIQAADISVLVHSGTDYQYTFTQLVTFLNANMATGAVINFSNTVPPNTDGKNGDLVINTTAGTFTQKVAGVWQLKYTIPAGVVGSTIYYGSGVPNNTTGIDGDTYLRTDNGGFYQKVSGVWVLKFSMATGPAGANGKTVLNGTTAPDNSIGVNGDFYINTTTEFIYGPKASGMWPAGVSLVGPRGNSVLTGTAPPSNSDDGIDGDYFINKSTYFIYGPKASGTWPAGVSLITNTTNFKNAYVYQISDSRFVYDATTLTLTFNLNTTDQALFPYTDTSILMAMLRKSDGPAGYKYRANYDYNVKTDGTNWTSVVFEGVVIEASLTIVLY